MVKLFSLLISLTPLALAQLPAGNEAGVSMGHLHLNTKDVEASKRFWGDQLGGSVVKFGRFEVVKFPGTIVFLTKADPGGGTEGSSVDHVGFLVRDLNTALAKWKANSVTIARVVSPVQLFLMSPEGVKVEIYEDKTISAPVVNHHIHFWTSSVDDTKAWYV